MLFILNHNHHVITTISPHTKVILNLLNTTVTTVVISMLPTYCIKTYEVKFNFQLDLIFTHHIFFGLWMDVLVLLKDIDEEWSFLYPCKPFSV